MKKNKMKNKLTKEFLSLLPQKMISKQIGKIMKSSFSKKLIKLYAQHYQIDIREAEKPFSEYKNLTEFFTRHLKKEARMIDNGKDTIISPVDGTISQMGKIENGKILQVKGIDYTVSDLLGEKEKSQTYENGQFVTIYLSPSDYHRIHAPYKGEIIESTYIPGRLFPVNHIGITQVKGLFTKNERLITYMKTNLGEIALVKVGAFVIGSVQVNYPFKNIKRKGDQIEKEEVCPPLVYEKGEEIGYFEFGSTVILLFEKDAIELNKEIVLGQKIQLGERIGKKIF